MANSQLIEDRPTCGSEGHGGNIQEISTNRVLVVDDESGIRSLLSRVLTSSGYAVDAVSDGYHALRILEEMSYDALIVDLKMPGMNGLNLYAHLDRAHNPLSRRMIFITGDTVARENRSFAEATENPVVEKPFALDEIRRRLSSLLDGRSVQRRMQLSSPA